MPEVERIEAIPCDVPLKNPLSWGRGHRLSSLQHVLITVTLSDGARGTAEATPRPTIYGETQDSVLAIVDQCLGPSIAGQSVNSLADIDALETALHLIKGNNTAKGALNIALHAALARSQGISLAALLGITQDRVPVSYIVGTGKPDEVLDDVARIYAAGVRMFKVKIGKNLEQELATLRELMVSFPEARFYVDANQCLTPEAAGEVLEELAEMGVAYCEEPLPVHRIADRQALKQLTRMPIIGDDSCFTVDDVQREMAFNTVDIVNIKTARTGFSQSRAICRMVSQSGQGVMVGSQASSLHGCLHAALFAAYTRSSHPVECTFYLKTDILLDDAPALIDGDLLLPSALGV